MRILNTRALSAGRDILLNPIKHQELVISPLFIQQSVYEIKVPNNTQKNIKEESNNETILFSAFFRQFGSKHHDNENVIKKRKFDLNIGKAIDTLRHDIPLLFKESPNLDIFAQDIKLFDPKGIICTGKYKYSMILNSLRIAKHIPLLDEPTIEIKTLRYHKDSHEIHVKFMIIANTPIVNTIQFEAVSRYCVNQQGLINEHHIDNVTRNRLFKYNVLPMNWGMPSPSLSAPSYSA